MISASASPAIVFKLHRWTGVADSVLQPVSCFAPGSCPDVLWTLARWQSLLIGWEESSRLPRLISEEWIYAGGRHWVLLIHCFGKKLLVCPIMLAPSCRLSFRIQVPVSPFSECQHQTQCRCWEAGQVRDISRSQCSCHIFLLISPKKPFNHFDSSFLSLAPEQV